ncbi:hypothetical protein BY996DRAFT_6513210 [Phakopsora pachyrhizi]|nr:hypothetical protein BY996DRAFT_6513210 [Phakopsora pachyrhizi]
MIPFGEEKEVKETQRQEKRVATNSIPIDMRNKMDKQAPSSFLIIKDKRYDSIML